MDSTRQTPEKKRPSPMELELDLSQLYDFPSSELAKSEPFLALLRCPDLDKESLLSAIPSLPSRSGRPLNLLFVLLKELPGPWPTFALIQCFDRLVGSHSDGRGRNAGNGNEPGAGSGSAPWDAANGLVEATETRVKQSCPSLVQLLQKNDDRAALRSTNAAHFLTQRALYDFVSTFAPPLHSQPGTYREKPVVAIVLPNGPLWAAVSYAVATYCTAALIDSGLPTNDIQAGLRQIGAAAVVTSFEGYRRLGPSMDGIRVFLTAWDPSGTIQVSDEGGNPVSADKPKSSEPNGPDEVCLAFLSGGNSEIKEVVSFTTFDIIREAVRLQASLHLSSEDVCLSMMGFQHGGDFVRDVLVPLWSGGSTVCCASFDTNLFWDMMLQHHKDDRRPTWYYAPQFVHSAILGSVSSHVEDLRKSKLRLICGAAADSLWPALERDLRDTFQCAVLGNLCHQHEITGSTPCHVSGSVKTGPGHHSHTAASSTTTAAGHDAACKLVGQPPLALGPPAPAFTTSRRVYDRGGPLPLDYEDPGGRTAPSSSASSTTQHGAGSVASTVSAPDYLGDDGYHYVMGRGKENIDRAGEFICPFEVEAAIISAATTEDSPISGRITDTLAFSIPHAGLGHAVAVVLVIAPGSPRVDIKTLHCAVRPRLSPSKWPVMIVYMDALPRKHGKKLRTSLADRLGLPRVSPETKYLARHWEATCPPPEASVNVDIVASHCRIDRQLVTDTMKSIVPDGFRGCVRLDRESGSLEAILAPKAFGSAPLSPDWANSVKRMMTLTIHNYMIPNKVHLLGEPFPEDPKGQVDEEGLMGMIGRLHSRSNSAKPKSKGDLFSTEALVTRAFADVLGCKVSKVSSSSANFFTLGGDSVAATKLLKTLRSEFNLHLPATLVFNHGTVKAISVYIDAVSPSTPYTEPNPPLTTETTPAAGCGEKYSSTNWLVMLVQLIPMVIFYPIRRATQWTIFLTTLSHTRDWHTNYVVYGRFVNLVGSITFAYIVIQLLGPWIGIICKWLIVGRYREGHYPMWGAYHTRCWLAQKLVGISGAGFFNTNDFTKSLYCRLMGAKIGKNVRLTGAVLGEWDLLDIRDGATLDDKSVCRPFGVEQNATMHLGRIVIGEKSVVGVSSVVAPGCEVPANTCIGLNSSSWELQDADEANRDLSPNRAPSPHWALTVFGTFPVYVLRWFVTLIPWFIGLIGLVTDKPLVSQMPLRDILEWFPTSPSVVFHYVALIMRALISPYFTLGFAVLVRLVMDYVFGKLQPGPHQGRGNIDIWRRTLMKSMLSHNRFREITELFGQRYGAMSTMVRMLGGRVGERVYWPWFTPNIGDFHLVDIGNDVVIGNRTNLVTTDGLGSEKIWVRDRAVLGERACLLPGVDVGENTFMEAGALAPRGRTYPPHGTYLGARGSEAVCVTSGRDMPSLDKLSTRRGAVRQMGSKDTLVQQPKKALHYVASSDTLVGAGSSETSTGVDKDSLGDKPIRRDASPFTKSNHGYQTPAYIAPNKFVVWLYSTFMAVFTPFYWNIPVICSVKMTGRIFINHVIPRGDDFPKRYDPLALWVLASAGMIVLTTVCAVVALGAVVGAKRLLLGCGYRDWSSQPASYTWRKQAFMTIERLVHRCYRNKGIVGLLSGTHWLVLYYRALGAQIGRDCALFAGGRMDNAMALTEPELVVLGDRVTIDDASILATRDIAANRGAFEFGRRVEIGDGCVLRTGSCVMGGARLGRNACLLEHTLVAAGDQIGAGWIMQGSPAERFSPKMSEVTTAAAMVLGAIETKDADESGPGSRSNSDATLVGEE